MKITSNIVPVIISYCYNQAHVLDTYFQSLLSQTRRPFRVILIDDASNDGSDQIIEKWYKSFNDENIDFQFEISNIHFGRDQTLKYLTRTLDKDLTIIWDVNTIFGSNLVDNFVKRLRDNENI